MVKQKPHRFEANETRPGNATGDRSRSWRSKPEKTKADQPAGRPHGIADLPPQNAIFGLHAAKASLLNPRRKILCAYLTENALAKLEPSIARRDISVTPVKPAK